MSFVIGKLLSGRALTEFDRQIIFIADRYFHILECIEPESSMKIFLQDRFELSTAAHYEAVTHSTADFLGHWQYPVLNGVYKKPDIVFYLRISPEQALLRQSCSGKKLDRYEGNLRKMKALVNAYENQLKVFGNVPRSDPRRDMNIMVVDASKSASRVFEEVKNIITYF